MRPFNIALAFGAVCLLMLLSGCYVPDMIGPCCSMDAAKAGMCNMTFPPNQTANGRTVTCGVGAGRVDANTRCTQTSWCVLPNASKSGNETVYLMYASGSSTPVQLNCSGIDLSNKTHPCNNVGYCMITLTNNTGGSWPQAVPVCSDRTEMAYDDSCKTMLCGNIKYSPKTSFFPEPAKNPMYQNIGSSYTQNLYNAKCNFYTLDNTTMKKLKSGSNIFINTFRFGMGSEISDFEEGRWYFPLSDKFCSPFPTNMLSAGQSCTVVLKNSSNTSIVSAPDFQTGSLTNFCVDHYVNVRVVRIGGVATAEILDTGPEPGYQHHAGCSGKGTFLSIGGDDWHTLYTFPVEAEVGSAKITLNGWSEVNPGVGYYGSICSFTAAVTATEGGVTQIPAICAGYSRNDQYVSFNYKAEFTRKKSVTNTTSIPVSVCTPLARDRYVNYLDLSPCLSSVTPNEIQTEVNTGGSVSGLCLDDQIYGRVKYYSDHVSIQVQDTDPGGSLAHQNCGSNSPAGTTLEDGWHTLYKITGKVAPGSVSFSLAGYSFSGGTCCSGGYPSCARGDCTNTFSSETSQRACLKCSGGNAQSASFNYNVKYTAITTSSSSTPQTIAGTISNFCTDHEVWARITHDSGKILFQVQDTGMEWRKPNNDYYHRNCHGSADESNPSKTLDNWHTIYTLSDSQVDINSVKMTVGNWFSSNPSLCKNMSTVKTLTLSSGSVMLDIVCDADGAQRPSFNYKIEYTLQSSVTDICAKTLPSAVAISPYTCTKECNLNGGTPDTSGCCAYDYKNKVSVNMAAFSAADGKRGSESWSAASGSTFYIFDRPVPQTSPVYLCSRLVELKTPKYPKVQMYRSWLTTAVGCNLPTGTPFSSTQIGYAYTVPVAGAKRLYSTQFDYSTSTEPGTYCTTPDANCSKDADFYVFESAATAISTANASAGAGKYYGSFNPGDIQNRSLCASEGSLATNEFPPAPDGNYIFTQFTEGTSQFKSTYVMPDSQFYKLQLRGAYWGQMNGVANTTPADFECNSSLDCMSGICSTDDYGYKRGFCVDKATGKELNCMCYEVGTRMQADNEILCDPYEAGSSPLNVLQGSIQFMPNQTEDGGMGYAFMSESDFQKTMFYQACGPAYQPSERCQKVVLPLWGLPANSCAIIPNQFTIMDFGRCDADDGASKGSVIDTFPKIKSVYGWCDGCTLSTVVGIDLDSYWRKFRRIVSDPAIKQPPAYSLNCPSTMGPDNQNEIAGIMVGIQSGPYYCGDKIREYFTNLAYLRNRVDAYAKSGVIPLVWYLDGYVNQTEVLSGKYMAYHDCYEHNGGTFNNYDMKPMSPLIPNMTKKIRSVLLGNFFYYYPDSAPFFESVSATCSVSTYKCYGGDVQECNDPIEASGSAGAGGTGAISLSGAGVLPDSGKNGTIDLLNFGAKDRCSETFCQWTAGYHFLRRAIGNSAAILVLMDDSAGTSPAAAAAAVARAKEAKQDYNCPNCLVAVYSPHANQSRLDTLFGCVNQADCKSKSILDTGWKYIDVVVYDYMANEVDGMDRNEAILNGSTSASRAILQRYGKPSVQNFMVDDTKNAWSQYNSTFSAMKYLLSNQSDLVTSGQIMLFYKQWFGDNTMALASPMKSISVSQSTERPPSYKDDKFCAFERAVDVYLMPTKRRTVFNMLPLSNSTSAEAQCVECTETEVRFGMCNTTCENGVSCNMPANVTGGNYKCADGVALEPCTPCSNSTLNVGCNRTYDDNSYDTVSYLLSNISSPSYGDIISSLPKASKCCLEYYDNETGERYNYTFTKVYSDGAVVMPVRFPASGDPNLDCGLSPEASSFCGVDLPVRNYQIDCSVVP
jgi:hypothetical protein